jgi:hypothetical protein
MSNRQTIYDMEFSTVIIDINIGTLEVDNDSIPYLKRGDICIIENGRLIKKVDREDLPNHKEFCIYWQSIMGKRAMVSAFVIPHPMSFDEFRNYCLEEIRMDEWKNWYFSIKPNRVIFKKQYNINPLVKLINWIKKYYSTASR